MPQGFIIMQIGNPDLDQVCEIAMVPALEACGLEAKRVDKHNQGRLLKSEIDSFIQEAEVIVADITNERPNCYLEIGYAMGLDKFNNLILTVREDHIPDNPCYVQGGPKVHFDLAGYDILSWHPDKLIDFKLELEKRISRRQAVLAPSSTQPPSVWDEEWIELHRNEASQKFKDKRMPGYMEIRFALEHPKPDISQAKLNDAARNSTIDTFGWPIGVYLSNRPEYCPSPRADGIMTKIDLKDQGTFDYWALRRNCDFYLLKTIFENMRDATKLFFDTRIIRVTETLLYCARIYRRLGIEPTTSVRVAIKHGAFKGRTLGAGSAKYLMPAGTPTEENEIETQVSSSIEGLESNLVQLVRALTGPLFVLFDYFEPPDETYEQIVNAYVDGKVI